MARVVRTAEPSQAVRTAVITDARYRATVAAVRTLGRAGWRVVVTQTRDDEPHTPPAFVSRYTAAAHWIPGSVSEPAYADRLLDLLETFRRPVLLCGGAVTLNTVSWQRARFAEAADFLAPPPSALDALNDKEAVHRKCLELRIPVPEEFSGVPKRYPVVVKPRCGERFGLKAAERYIVAEDEGAWRRAVAAMAAYDPAPLVQEKVPGVGMGASLLLGRQGELLGALCHRRIREYPVTGGPSACCESVYDEDMVETAHRLLRAFGFQGLAMVEFKGPYLLEVNPRIWGSFPLTEKAGSPLAVNYARAAAGETFPYTPHDYQEGVRMRFLLNDSAAMLSLLRRGQARGFLSALPDCLHAEEALSSREDPKPFRQYLRNTLSRGRRQAARDSRQS